MKSRRMNVDFGQFLINNSVEDLVVQGSFNPKDDIIEPEIDRQYFHYKIKNLDEWGVTFPEKEKIFDDSFFQGYFHNHERERVYLSPPLSIGMFTYAYDGLIPCFECKVAIRMVWEKQ